MQFPINFDQIIITIFKKKNSSPPGNWTPVSRVTGGDTYLFTVKDQMIFCRVFFKLTQPCLDSSFGRALDSSARGPGFKSRPGHQWNSLENTCSLPSFHQKKRYLTVLYMETEVVLKTDLNSLFQFFSVHCST